MLVLRQPKYSPSYAAYTLSYGACLQPPKPSDPNCNVVDLSGNCIGCNFQYFLNSALFCVKINLYCLTTNSLGQCTSCPAGLTLINGNCIYSDANCQSPNYDSITCDACRPGYEINSDGRTCRLVQACVQFAPNSNTTCVQCIPNYQLI